MPNYPADQDRYDIAVVGAGPAGLAAAASAARAGARVALIDAGARPGGQYWRNRPGDTGKLHHGWRIFTALRDELHRRADRIAHLTQHSVWHVGPGDDESMRWQVHAATPDGQRRVGASALIIATGAYDRQIPFPGWTLPGVYAAGAVQALLKGNGVLAGRRFVVGGTGPFLLAVAAGLADAGADVAGVFEAGSPAGFARAPLAVARNAAKMSEGVHYTATMLRRRIPYHTRAAITAAHGESQVSGVTVAKLDRNWNIIAGSENRIDCDTVAVGYGFTPQLELALQLDCDTHLDVDGSLVATADAGQRSSVDNVYLAGEVCGVAGAAASVTEGHIAGLHAAAAVGAHSVDASALRRLTRQRSALRSFATAMHTTFPVASGWTTWLDDDTTVCRCEEITVGDVDDAITELGAIDARAVKLYARPGMGMCQGRVCGYATGCLVAARADRPTSADDLRGVARRPIAQPVPLGDLASEDSRF